MRYSYIYFDVAGTLLYKMGLYESIRSALEYAGFPVPLEVLRRQHRTVSELLCIPDETSRQFYERFNSEFLYSLDIIPTQRLLDDLYRRCKSLPWRAYDDVAILSSIPVPKGILSNWDTTLTRKLADLVPCSFDSIFGSAQTGLRKPAKKFYRQAFVQTRIPFERILYVGDSVRLDVEPALSLGATAILIDREEQYPWYAGKRIRTLSEINTLLQD